MMLALKEKMKEVIWVDKNNKSNYTSNNSPNNNNKKSKFLL
jgi:hypothetical protein